MELTKEEIMQKYRLSDDLSEVLGELARVWKSKGVLVDNIGITLEGLRELPKTQLEQELAEALEIVHREERNLIINLNNVHKSIWDKVFEKHLIALLDEGISISMFNSYMTRAEFAKELIGIRDGEVVVIHEDKYGAPLKELVIDVMDDIRTSGKKVRSIITLGRVKSDEMFRIY